MNVNQSINKLLFALQQKGQLYKVNTFQFYSDKAKKYCTKYQVLKKELVEAYNTETDKVEYKEKYNQKEETYSKIDLLKYFMKEYKGMG